MKKIIPFILLISFSAMADDLQVCKGPLLSARDKVVQEVEWKLKYWHDSLVVELEDKKFKVQGKMDTKGEVSFKDKEQRIVLTPAFGENGPYYIVHAKLGERKLTGIVSCK